MSSIPGSVRYTMFIEPTITWVPSGFSEYIWLDTIIVLKKFGNAFQIFEATDEQDFEVVMVASREEHTLTKMKMSGGTEMVDNGLMQIVILCINVLI